MNYGDRIVRDPKTCGGEPVIMGTRVTLRTVLASLPEGATIQEIVEDFPTLAEEDVRAVIAFAAASAQEDLPVHGVPAPPPGSTWMRTCRIGCVRSSKSGEHEKWLLRKEALECDSISRPGRATCTVLSRIQTTPTCSSRARHLTLCRARPPAGGALRQVFAAPAPAAGVPQH